MSLTHANKTGIKTTAPISFLWDILRVQGKKNPKGPLGNLSEASPGYKVMSKVSTNAFLAGWSVHGVDKMVHFRVTITFLID